MSVDRPTRMIRDTLIASSSWTLVPATRVLVDEVPELKQVDPYCCIKELSPNVRDEEYSDQERWETQVIEIRINSNTRQTVTDAIDQVKSVLDKESTTPTSPRLIRLEFLNDFVSKSVGDRFLYTGVVEYRVHTQRTM